MKRIGKRVAWIAAVLLIGGVGGAIVQQFVVPTLATYPWARNWPLVRSLQERTTIIERTKEVRVTQETVTRDTVAQLRGSIALVVTRQGEKRLQATGVFVTNDGVLAVDAAVVPPGDGVSTEVFLPSGTSFRVTRVTRDAVTGIALLFSDDYAESQAVSLSRVEDLFVGQHLVGLGVDFALHDHISAYETQLVSLGSGPDALRVRQWQGVLTVFGAADAEVFVTNRGELAGIGTRRGIVPVSAVRFALERFVKGRSGVTPEIGITYHVATPMRDGATAGVVVETVAPALQGALRKGDRITHVDDVALSDYATLTTLVDARLAAGAESVALRVVRDGATRTVTVPLPAPPEA